MQISCGALAMSSALAGLFFLRFWRECGDRLFLFFTAAFWLLGAHWLALGLVDPALEDRTGLYALRLAAFVLLALGIADKNRAVAGRRADAPR